MTKLRQFFKNCITDTESLSRHFSVSLFKDTPQTSKYCLVGIAACLISMVAVLFVDVCYTTAAHADYEEEIAQHAQAQEMATLTALDLQNELESCQQNYEQALAEVEKNKEALNENKKRIAQLEKEIPEKQERCKQAIRELYKLQKQSAGVVSLILSADSFYSFLRNIELIGKVAEANTQAIQDLKQLKVELDQSQKDLMLAQRDTHSKAEDAKIALERVQEAQAEVQRRIEEEARAQAEIAAQAAALVEHPRNNDSPEPAGGGDSSDSGDGGGGSGGDIPAPSGDGVEGWAARIDAYLAGSPLAGQGHTFAQAALANGVDPRLSPAISYTESSKGLYCFKPYNAWGWGSASWSSWEEAINAHVAGLARGYGGRLTIEGARKYCPSNAQAWYDRTLAQMQMI